MAPDPNPSESDPLDAERLRAFFSSVRAQHPTESQLSAQGATPPGTPPPPPRQAPVAPVPPPVAPPPAYEAHPAPTGPPLPGPTPADAPASPGTSVPSVDMVALVRYLDAQLELTRQRADEGVERLADLLAALDARVADLDRFRTDLFTWLDSYVDWESRALNELAERISTAP